MRKRGLLLIIVLLFVALSTYGIQNQFERAVGLHSTDGDCIKVEFVGDGRESVRYNSVNAPKKDQCFGPEATSYNDQLIKGKNIWLELNPVDDGYEKSYQRVLAYPFLGPARTQSNSVEILLVEKGYARLDVRNPNDDDIMEGKDFNVRYADWIIEAQRKAVLNRRGWWRMCDEHTETNFVIAVIKQWSEDEVVYLVNRGDSPIDLAAEWILKDSTGGDRNTLDFSDHFYGKCLLPPAGVLRIHSGSIATGRGGEHTACGKPEIDLMWTGHHIWNNNKDKAELHDLEGEVVDRYEYPLQWD